MRDGLISLQRYAAGEDIGEDKLIRLFENYPGVEDRLLDWECI